MKTIPLYKQIVNDILQQIYLGKLRPNDRIPSENELSKQYMVSSITSKNALIELADRGFAIRVKGKGTFVSPLEKLISIPEFNRTTASRSMMQAKTIGLILPSMKTAIDQQLLNAIEEEIDKTEYILAVTITRELQKLESAAIHKYCASGVSGLIIFPTENEMYNEDILKLSFDHFPFVFVDRYLKGIRANSVTSNNYEITKQVIGEMLLKGKRNIGFISPSNNNSVTADRLSGFEDAFSEHGSPLYLENLCMLDAALATAEQKYNKIYEFITLSPKIDSLFCVNQEMAFYVHRVLQGLNKLQNYTLCCFDEPSFGEFSYIKQDIPQIARNCVQLLIDHINGNYRCKEITVPAEFISRNMQQKIKSDGMTDF